MRTSVFRPPGAGPFPLAVINHGSTQNEIRTGGFRQPQYTALTEWLVARGYAVAVPQRPGHGETGGPYYEAQGGCANADYRQGRAGRGVEHRSRDRLPDAARRSCGRPARSRSAIPPAAGVRWRSRRTHLRPLAGGGRVRAGTRRPHRRRRRKELRAGPADRCGADVSARRRACRRFGSTAENDSYFPPALSKRMVDAFRAGGGRVTYDLLPPWDRMGTS